VLGPPPPPPSGGMGAILTPIAVPAPMIDTVVPQFNIGTPRRGKSEEPTPVPTFPFGLGGARSRAPRAPRASRSRSKGPAPLPMETEEVPQYVPVAKAKAKARGRSASATPVPTIGAAAAAMEVVDAPDVIPVPKAKAKAKARGRSVEQVPVSKRKASIKPASEEPETPVIRPRAKSVARSLGPDLPDVIPQMTKPRKKANNMQTPAATAAAIGKDPELEITTKPTAKIPVPRAKRVPSAAPQGNRKPVVLKVPIAPAVKVAAGLPGTKARKSRNKVALVAEIEKLKA
jgi:hypothetical protein